MLTQLVVDDCRRRGSSAPFVYMPCLEVLKDPEVPSTQYSRSLVPKSIKGMIVGTRKH